MMTSFLGRLFRGKIPPEQQQAVLDYLTEEWKMGALRDMEAARHTDAMARLMDSEASDSEDSNAVSKEHSLATKRVLERMVGLQGRHSELKGVPAAAHACYHRWSAAYVALVEELSTEAATYSELESEAEAGKYAVPDFGRIMRVHAAREAAHHRAEKEQEKLLGRLDMGDEEIQRLKLEAEAAATGEASDEAR